MQLPATAAERHSDLVGAPMMPVTIDHGGLLADLSAALAAGLLALFDGGRSRARAEDQSAEVEPEADLPVLLDRIGEERGCTGSGIGDVVSLLATGAGLALAAPIGQGDRETRQAVAMSSSCLAIWLDELVGGYVRGQQRQVRESQARLKQLCKAAVGVVEGERARLSREIHDEAGQLLSATLFQVDQALNQREHAATTAAELQGIRDLLLECSHSLHRLSVDLRPPILADLGLAATLQWFVRQSTERYPFRVELELGDLPARLDGELELAVFRIVQEAVANASRHAHPTRVGIRVEPDGHGIRVTINDNGVGFTPQDRLPEASGDRARPSLGVLGMGERAAALGGKLEIRSQPGQGTTVNAWLPLGRRKGI